MRGGLYIHVPFCRRKCPYCDFVVVETDKRQEAEFLERIKREMDDVSYHRRDLQFEAETLYFGGGTPSSLAPDQISRMVESARKFFKLSPAAEVTLEANPEDADIFILAEYRDAGINRLSLGVQSFDYNDLRVLGRLHAIPQALRAVRAARAVDFYNINIDLIFGVPGQTLDTWKNTLKVAAELQPSHVSLYGLTYEPGTRFTRFKTKGKLETLPDELCRQQYETAMNYLSEHKYTQYELSNFAKEGAESQHNRIYWDRRPYIGLGPGAHSFIPEQRSWNLSNVRRYMTLPSTSWRKEDLTEEQQHMEKVMLGLRQMKGLQMGANFKSRNAAKIEKYQKEGLVLVEGDCLSLTINGRIVADTLIEEFTS